MQHKDADIVCTLLNISRHSYHTLSLFKIQHVCYNNFNPGVITPSISQRGQRAHENLSRGRGRSENKTKLTPRTATRREREKINLKIQHSPRRHTPRTATENTKRNQTITLATAAT